MTALLRAANVSLAFGGLLALNDVSIEVPDGAIVGLIGPNGAGKTTLFNVISGLLAADQGSIVFDGNDITRLPAPKRAALGIGRSFQNLGLIQTETARTNLMAAQFLSAAYRGTDVLVRPWRWWREERRAATRAMTIAADFELSEHLDERIVDLSFGVARFVELACVLTEHPRLMMLDEPTTGLDTREVNHLLTILRAQRGAGQTILVVAHDVRFVMEVCDYVYVLNAGAVLAQGTPQQVQASPEVVAVYLGRSA
ncbi:MAG: ABC transporter ATP-binding protein [Acidimicrobiales bacterium]